MCNKTFFIICLTFCLLCPYSLWAQYRVLDKKFATVPVWMKGVSSLYRSNDTYEYIIVDNAGESLQSLEAGRIASLGQKLSSINKISGVIDKTVENTNKDGNFSSEVKHKMTFRTETEVYEFVSNFVDDYWEYVIYPDGSKGYIYYALFAVSKGTGTQTPIFDSVSFSTQYGTRGLWRSAICPGWGQMYKGSSMKGFVLLGAEVAAIGGIIYTENARASYTSKMYSHPYQAHQYKTLVDNFTMARNCCIGAAAAVYVYNLIDALVAPGARRIVVKPHNLGISPMVSQGGGGLSLSYNF